MISLTWDAPGMARDKTRGIRCMITWLEEGKTHGLRIPHNDQILVRTNSLQPECYFVRIATKIH